MHGMIIYTYNFKLMIAACIPNYVRAYKVNVLSTISRTAAHVFNDHLYAPVVTSILDKLIRALIITFLQSWKILPGIGCSPICPIKLLPGCLLHVVSMLRSRIRMTKTAWGHYVLSIMSCTVQFAEELLWSSIYILFNHKLLFSGCTMHWFNNRRLCL